VGQAEDVNTDFVRASDGATIAYLSTGAGPSVIVVPGTLATASRYAAFAAALGEHCSVHVIERRGRGGSSPQGDNYTIEQDCADVDALQRVTGASLLVGHSFGGLIALEVARRNRAFAKVAVYEPAVSIDGSISLGWAAAYDAMLHEGRGFDALVEFTRAAGPVRLRRAPRWALKLAMRTAIAARDREEMLPLLRQNLREHRQIAALDSHVERYQAIDADVLLMAGADNELGWVTNTIGALASVIPRCETIFFPALDHLAMQKKSGRAIAAVVQAFFAAYRRHRQ
jgi:pimeloyl-ACP methyl ester carboxylesterase